MPQTKLTVQDLKDEMEHDDSVNLILATDPENIEDPEIATRWQAAIDAITELDRYIHSHE